MINNTRSLTLASLIAVLMIGGASEARAACNLMVPPISNNVCQQEDQTLPGYGLISCASPRNPDQTTFCGAVYGYEQHWCARIRNPVLRQECWDRVE
jgi:hypothetical protein